MLLIAYEAVYALGSRGSKMGSQNDHMHLDLITTAEGLTSAYAQFSSYCRQR